MRAGGFITPQDLAAALVSVILTLGVVVLAIEQQDVPGAMAAALGQAMTWVFIRSVQEGGK